MMFARTHKKFIVDALLCFFLKSFVRRRRAQPRHSPPPPTVGYFILDAFDDIFGEIGQGGIKKRDLECASEDGGEREREQQEASPTARYVMEMGVRARSSIRSITFQKNLLGLVVPEPCISVGCAETPPPPSATTATRTTRSRDIIIIVVVAVVVERKRIVGVLCVCCTREMQSGA